MVAVATAEEAEVMAEAGEAAIAAVEVTAVAAAT